MKVFLASHLSAQLELEDVLPFLLRLGLATREDIVQSADVAVQARKNLSYIVTFSDRSLLVKCSNFSDDPGIHLEAAFYSDIVPSREDLKRLTPAFHAYDKERSLIVLEYLSSYHDFRRRFSSQSRISTSLGATLGRAVATVHRTHLDDFNARTVRPWVLNLLEPPIEILITESNGTLDVLRRIQANHVYISLIEETANSWQADGLCHGDLRLDNLLYGPRGSVIIVDWELSGVTSTSWDIGCLFASYAEFWLTSASRPKDDPAGTVTPNNRSLLRFQPMLRDFLHEYKRSAPASAGDISATRISQMIALRLLQAALEYSQMYLEATKQSIMLLTLAERFAASPLESWRHILGLPLSESSGHISL